jgi:outer membrane protein OmpA-like peptidoglycan-associated protein
VALTLQTGVPLGSASHDLGADPGVWVWPQIVVEKKFGITGLALGANVGYRAHAGQDPRFERDTTGRPQLAEGILQYGDLGTFGLALSFRATDALDVVAESYGSYLVGTESDSRQKLSQEVLGGLKLFVEKNSYLMIGAGSRAFSTGFEAADLRMVLGFVYEPSIGDRDADGIPDDVDQCPDQPEDFDGFEDSDGCPDLDNDHDGVPDSEDRCPNLPGPRDNQGCPVVHVPAKFSDRDHDGIPDNVDKCPDDPETYNGYQDDDGCPDKPIVVVQGSDIVILQKVQFETDSATIKPESDPVLDAVAETLKAHPEFEVVEVAGHADERGSDAHNLALTKARAASVARALERRGIAPSRLVSQGYGEYCPLDPASNPQAWEQNRRVEFKVVKTDEGLSDARRGCDAAKAKGVVPPAVR